MERIGHLIEKVVSKVFEQAIADVPLVQSGRYPGWENVVEFAKHGRGELAEDVRRKLGMECQLPTSGNPLVASLKSAFRFIKSH